VFWPQIRGIVPLETSIDNVLALLAAGTPPLADLNEAHKEKAKKERDTQTISPREQNASSYTKTMLLSHSTSPMTNAALDSRGVWPNHALTKVIR
jgi:hypothetical protein